MDTLNIICGVVLLLTLSFFWTVLVRKVVNVVRRRTVPSFQRDIWWIFGLRLIIGAAISIALPYFSVHDLGLFSVLLDLVIIGLLTEYFDRSKFGSDKIEVKA